MSDRLDELERLRRLRGQGAIDEAEFAREKARVMGGDASPAGYRLLPVLGVVVVLALLAVAALFGWSLLREPRAGTPAATATPTPSSLATSQGVASLLPDERLAAAVRAAWPDGAAATGGDGEHYTFATHRLVDAPFGPVLVSEGTVDDAAHVSAGRLDITYLEPEGERYAVVRRFPAAVTAGSFGAMGGWSVGDKFAAVPVIDAEGGSTGQGYTCSYDVLTALTPQRPVTLATIQTGYDDSGAVEDGAARTVKGVIGDVVRDRSFVVHYTGTRSFDEAYRRAGDRYRVEGGESQVPTC